MARWTERVGAFAAHFTARPSSPGRDARPLRVLAILLPILLFSGFAWYDHQVGQQHALEELDSTADALAEHAQAILQTADLVLAHVLDHTQTEDWDTISHSPETHAFLLSLTQDLPQLGSVFLIDPFGVHVATSRQFPAEPLDDADRNRYIQPSTDGHIVHASHVNDNDRGQTDNTHAFAITRPRLRANTFDGVAGVTVAPQYFQTFYGAVLKHPHQATAALIRDDGALLAQFPDSGSSTRLSEGSPLLIAIRSGQSGGHLFDAFDRGNKPELTAFRRLQNWPVAVTYTIDTSIYRRGWYSHMILFAASTCLVGAALLLAEKVMLETSHQEVHLVSETNRRQQAESALLQAQKLEAVGRATSGVAHDFNNLLAAILGSLEMLQRYATQPRQVRLIITARKAAERGAQLTRQMLAFSRHKELVIHPVDTIAATRGLDQLLRQTVGPSISIMYHMAGRPCLAMANQTQLEVALLNLAVNARDAMPDGGTLTLGCHPVTQPADGTLAPGLPAGSYIEVFVQDTGKGMPEDVRQRVFEPFFTTKGPSKGTGLGLSMVFGFVTMVGGTAVVESAPDAGTTVRLFLPEATEQDLPTDQRKAGQRQAERRNPAETQQARIGRTRL